MSDEVTPEVRQARERYLAALESGQYRQIKGIMRQDDCFCVLGVLCDVERADLWEWRAVSEGPTVDGRFVSYELFAVKEDMPEWVVSGYRNQPPHGILERVGLQIWQSRKLVQMNDGSRGFTFSDCAETLRTWWEMPDGEVSQEASSH